MPANAFDDFARGLARDGDPLHTPGIVSQLNDRVIGAWLEREIADNDGSAGWTLRDVLDAITDREDVSRLVLDSARHGHYEIVGRLVTVALKTSVAQAAARKAAGDRWVAEWLSPLSKLIDHYDAIGSDQRALAREHNAMVRP